MVKENIYKFLPVCLQNVACTLSGEIKRRNRLTGKFDTIYEALKVTEWYDKDEIEEYQLRKLQELIEYCNRTVPYYRELFQQISLRPSDIVTLTDLEKIPILTKEIVRNNVDKLKNPNFRGAVIRQHTSGSTGTPLQFILSKEALKHRWAVWFRHRARFKIRPGDAYASFTSGQGAVPISQNKPPYWRENRAMKQTIFTMHHISNEKVPAIVKRLNAGGFCYYSGYPSILFSLAGLIEDLGLKITECPKIIFTGAESLLDYQREKISKVFGCFVTDQYGFSEGCGNASRCENDLFHEDFEYGILECYKPVVNEDGTK